MAVILTTLPAEITHEVLQAIDDSYTLLQLMQTSRYFYKLALSYLYRNITLRQYHVASQTDVVYWKSYALACRVLGDNNIAAMIRSISILSSTENSKRSHTSSNTGIPCEHLLNRNVVRAVNSLTCTKQEKKSWFKGFRQHCDSSMAIAIILPFLPNIQCLVITREWAWDKRCLSILKQTPCYTSFLALRQISIGEADTEMLFLNMNLILLFMIPSLQRISIHNLSLSDTSTGSELNIFNSMAGSINIDTLSLINTFLAPSEISVIVSACRELKTLNLSWEDAHMFLGDGEAWGPIHNIKILGQLLQPLSSTCETLRLEYLTAVAIWDWYWENDLEDPLAPLDQFSALKSLTIGMAFIFGAQHYVFKTRYKVQDEDQIWRDRRTYKDCLVNLLPPQLENLQVIRFDQEDIILLLKNVESVLSAIKQGQFRSLKVIAVEDRKNMDEDMDRDISNGHCWHVEDLAREVGVMFRFTEAEV